MPSRQKVHIYMNTLPLPFIDTHTHIYTDDFDANRSEVVGRAIEAGAQKLFLPNIDAASVEPMLRLCRQHPGLCYPMIGLHPTELPPNPQPVLDEMEQMLESRAAEFIAVGEVGIDLYWDASRREEQIAAFVRQAEWALRFGLPLMVHSRAAHRELVEALRPYASRLTGVFHCFGGTAEEAAWSLSRSSPWPPRSAPLCRSRVSWQRPTRPISLPRLTAASAMNRHICRLWSKSCRKSTNLRPTLWRSNSCKPPKNFSPSPFQGNSRYSVANLCYHPAITQ